MKHPPNRRGPTPPPEEPEPIDKKRLLQKCLSESKSMLLSALALARQAFGNDVTPETVMQVAEWLDQKWTRMLEEAYEFGSEGEEEDEEPADEK